MLTAIFALFMVFASSSVLGYLMTFRGDCSKYRECDNSTRGCYLRDCGPDTEFNPQTGVCGVPLTNRVGCLNRLNQTLSGGTYRGPHIFLLYPDDCTKYQECDESLGGCYVKYCQPKTEFNPKMNICDWPIPERIGCNNRIGGTYQGGRVRLPYPGDCKKYQECNKSLGDCHVKDCGLGTEFDPDTKYCMWPLTDRTDCLGS